MNPAPPSPPAPLRWYEAHRLNHPLCRTDLRHYPLPASRHGPSPPRERPGAYRRVHYLDGLACTCNSPCPRLCVGKLSSHEVSLQTLNKSGLPLQYPLMVIHGSITSTLSFPSWGAPLFTSFIAHDGLAHRPTFFIRGSWIFQFTNPSNRMSK